MKRKGINKIRNRIKLWDSIGWSYGEFPHKLWKEKGTGCQCALCKETRQDAKRKNKRDRIKIRKELKIFENE